MTESEFAVNDESSPRGEAKVVTIVVNGRPKEVSAKELSFGEVVVLAFGEQPAGSTMFFTMTYRRGQGSKPEGSLVDGESVKVKEGMIFNVTATDKS